jgi:hydrogenase nickel incorporation protein HypA/HybF
MREQPVIQAILDKVLHDRNASRSGRVKSLNIVKGDLFDTDEDTILRYWREISKDTPLERADLHFRRVPGEVQCMACFQKYHPRDGEIHCPFCGSYGAKIISGEEFYLESIEMNHEE